MAEFKFPLPVFYFEVKIGNTELSFQEVSGLDQEAQVLEYRHGNDKVFVTQKRLGLTKTGNISFKKGVFKSDNKLVSEFQKVLKKEYYSQGTPIELLVSLLDEKGEIVMSWKIANAVPVKLTAPTLKSDSNEVAIEVMEFAHEGVEVEVK